MPRSSEGAKLSVLLSAVACLFLSERLFGAQLSYPSATSSSSEHKNSSVATTTTVAASQLSEGPAPLPLDVVVFGAGVPTASTGLLHIQQLLEAEDRLTDGAATGRLRAVVSPRLFLTFTSRSATPDLNDEQLQVVIADARLVQRLYKKRIRIHEGAASLGAQAGLSTLGSPSLAIIADDDGIRSPTEDEAAIEAALAAGATHIYLTKISRTSCSIGCLQSIRAIAAAHGVDGGSVLLPSDHRVFHSTPAGADNAELPPLRQRCAELRDRALMYAARRGELTEGSMGGLATIDVMIQELEREHFGEPAVDVNPSSSPDSSAMIRVEEEPGTNAPAPDENMPNQAGDWTEV